MFIVHFGVRQGSSLSPYLFAVYVNDLAKLCLYKRGVYVVLYADDILLLAPSVGELHKLLVRCEVELDQLILILRNLAVCVLDRETTFAVPPYDFYCPMSSFQMFPGPPQKGFYRSANGKLDE